jgi:hypothetical protein
VNNLQPAVVGLRIFNVFVSRNKMNMHESEERGEREKGIEEAGEWENRKYENGGNVYREWEREKRERKERM